MYEVDLFMSLFGLAGNFCTASPCITCDFADMNCALERDLGLYCSHGNERAALWLLCCLYVDNGKKCTLLQPLFPRQSYRLGAVDVYWDTLWLQAAQNFNPVVTMVQRDELIVKETEGEKNTKNDGIRGGILWQKEWRNGLFGFKSSSQFCTLLAALRCLLHLIVVRGYKGCRNRHLVHTPFTHPYLGAILESGACL